MTQKDFQIAIIQSWIKQGMNREEAVELFNEMAAAV